jgi:hypothetical protein
MKNEVVMVPLSRGKVAVIDAADATLVGQFRWYAQASSTGGFYAATGVKGPDGKRTQIYMHRLITGAPKGKDVDHINHDTLDNRRANLRVGSHLDNMRNGKFALATHCPHGHEYTPENTHTTPKGHRRCRICARQQWSMSPEQYERHKENVRLRKQRLRSTPEGREYLNAQERAWRKRRKVDGDA